MCILTIVVIVYVTSLPDDVSRNIFHRQIVLAQKSSLFGGHDNSDANNKRIQNQTTTIPNGNLAAKLLSNLLENTLNRSATILEITSKLPEVNFAPYASSISPKLHGIPNDLDISKRKVAQSILAADKDFRVIFFFMPNGDVYMEEPYSKQLNLTKNNFAFRDYYKGAISTRATYLGNTILAASSGLPQVNIAVPIYSEKGGALLGLWGGGLDLYALSKSLRSLNLTNNNNSERIVYVDQNGQKLADSSQASANYYNASFANLESFKNAITGKSGSIIEVVNGTKMMVFYHPVKFHSTTWAVLLMQRS